MGDDSKKPIVLWLDDKKGEIQDQRELIERGGYVVKIAGDLTTFQDEVQELVQNGEIDSLRLVVLDIMLEGVVDISTYYKEVENGGTAHGYAAGLVFLERVVLSNAIYGVLLKVPLAVNSKRALEKGERRRIDDMVATRGIRIEVFEKSASRAIFDFLTEQDVK